MPECEKIGCEAIAQYEIVPCAHQKYCSTHARRIATGGKCKVCGSFFAELRKTELDNGESSADEEED